MKISYKRGLLFPAVSVIIVLCAFMLIRITGPGQTALSESRLYHPEPYAFKDIQYTELYWHPEIPVPGDFLIIEAAPLAEDVAVTVAFDFLGHSSIHYRVGENFYALIGISCDTLPGEYELKIISDEGSDHEALARSKIKIGSKDFQVSYFNVPPSATTGWTAERLAEDREKVRIARETSETHPLWLHKFIPPLEGRISSEYAAIRHINNNPPRRHNGIDIAAAEGTPVIAPNNGIVRLAEFLLSGGNTVIIDHGLDLSSTYMHLETINIEKGQLVERGEQIGTVGMTGYANGPHLHWELNIKEIPVNPMQLIDNDLLWIPPGYVTEMLSNQRN
jgi:hypothetical protein